MLQQSSDLLQVLKILNKIPELLIKAFDKAEINIRGLKELFDRRTSFIEEVMNLIKKYTQFDPFFGPVTSGFVAQFDYVPEECKDIEKGEKYHFKFYPVDKNAGIKDLVKFVELRGAKIINNFNEMKELFSLYTNHFPYEQKIICLSGNNIMPSDKNDIVNCIFHTSQELKKYSLEMFSERFIHSSAEEGGKYYLMCIIPVNTYFTGEEIF